MMQSHQQRQAPTSTNASSAVQMNEEAADDGGAGAVQALAASGEDGPAPVQAKVAPVMSHWAEDGGAPVQKHEAGGGKSTAGVHQAAAHGTSGGGSSLPHLDKIQKSFGKHDVSNVQAYSGGNAAAASKAMGAEAYAMGDKVAFKGSPGLHTAAHEAAHVVQQRGGVQLKGGVGQTGDKYEQHADAVADRVVQGKPAGDLLDQMAGGKGTAGVQKSEDGDVQMLGETLDKPLSSGAAKPEHGEDAGQQRRYSVEQYMEMWEKEQGRKLNEMEKATIARGCIGITANNLSGGGNPPLDQAYGSFEQANEALKKQNQALDQMRADPRMAGRAEGKHAVMFAKMFWSNQNADPAKRKKADPNAFKADPRTGKVDMKGYQYHGQPGYVNFDYAFWDESSRSFWHANHCQPGMKVYQSTKEKFAKGYIDFDRVIYCVAIAENYDPGLAAVAHVGSAGGGQSPHAGGEDAGSDHE